MERCALQPGSTSAPCIRFYNDPGYDMAHHGLSDLTLKAHLHQGKLSNLAAVL